MPQRLRYATFAILSLLPLSRAQTSQLKPLFTTPSLITASAVDEAQNLYIAGTTTAGNIPVTAGAFQTQFPSCPMPGCQHSFVAKIAPDGKQLLFATYFGGNGSDSIRAIVLDPAGNIYLSGATTSSNLPASAGAYQTQPGPAFVAKLAADGRSLLALTYLAGAQTQGLTLDSAGNVYVVGSTTQTTFQTTPSAYQTAPQGGADAFAIKLDVLLTNARYSTLIGGTFDDLAWYIAVDNTGAAYITGGTTSTPANAQYDHSGSFHAFPVTPGAVNQPSSFPGEQDVFILKLSADGSSLVYSALLGGSSTDVGETLTLDPLGAVYVAGTSSSPDFPISKGALQSTGELFALKLSADGSQLLYSTHLSGPYSASVPPLFQIAADASGNLLIHAAADDLVPTTPDSFLPCPTAGTASYVLQLSPDGTARSYASYVPQELAIRADGLVWYADASGNIKRFNIFDPLPAGPRCVANSLTYRTGPVAPGGFVSLFGPGIGPDQPAGAQFDAAGNLGIWLSGVSVYFNGIAAPLLYAGPSQINAIVPFELSLWPSTSVVVLKNGTVLQAMDLPVVPQNPTIVTTVEGCAAAVNPDGTLNSSTHPARLGSTISVYGVGGGVTNPAATTGAIGDGTHTIAAGVFAQLLVPAIPGPVMTAQAPVSYAGDAPGLVEGVFQINLTLPDIFGIGKQALNIFIGAASSGGMCLWLAPKN